MDQYSYQTTSTAQLQHLVVIRSLILACLLLGGGISFWFFNAQLPLAPLLLILGLFSVINLLTWGRLHQSLPVTEIEIFVQLLVDVLCLGLLFYFSGGANNPFVSYFLVPICIAATTLTWTYAWIISLFCLLAYTLLLFFYIPLPLLSPHHSHEQTSELNPHILGMWLNFFISAVLITYFVVRMARDLRKRDEKLSRHREDELRNEQLMAIATLAAGTAHELGTPLTTMKILIGELRSEYATQPQLKQDLALLNSQIEECTRTLRQLNLQAQESYSGQFASQSLRNFCTQIIEQWQIMRPEVTTHIEMAAALPEVFHTFHLTIRQSLINVLNNAADANPNNIRIRIKWDTNQLNWTIEDEGPGVPLELADQLGKTFVTTKGHGLGLGLFLTHATINRYGGQIRLYNRKPKGALTEVVIPLKIQNIMTKDKA